MKQTTLLFATIILATTAGASPRALREHMDTHWTYDEVDGWTCLAKTEVEGGDLFEELEDVYLPIDDAPVGSNGQRYIQSPDEAFDFTGVPAGEPIWIAFQIQQPGQCWPGFNNYQEAGVFGSYRETDPRLSEDDRSLSLPWIKLSLAGVSYQGSGTGAFSLWFEDSGVPTVWMSTSDNTHPDTYLFVAGSHQHLNWGFGSPGIYRIRLTASAFRGPGQSNPTGTSDVFTVTFAVGAFAQWQADHFTATELDDELICGPDADPDNDGLKNSIEFAFGMCPRQGAMVPIAQGLGLPVFDLFKEGGIYYERLTYPKRRDGDQFAPMSYTPQFSDLLGPSWQTNGVEQEAHDFTGDQAFLNGVWETVTVKRPVGVAPPSRRFARVAVSPFGAE